jgi:hypothetical protein
MRVTMNNRTAMRITRICHKLKVLYDIIDLSSKHRIKYRLKFCIHR